MAITMQFQNSMPVASCHKKKSLDSADTQNAENNAESAFASRASMCPDVSNDQKSVENGKPVLKVCR